MAQLQKDVHAEARSTNRSAICNTMSRKLIAVMQSEIGYKVEKELNVAYVSSDMMSKINSRLYKAVSGYSATNIESNLKEGETDDTEKAEECEQNRDIPSESQEISNEMQT